MLCGEGPLDPWTPGGALQGPVFKGMPMHAGPLWAGPWQGSTSHPARKQLSGRITTSAKAPQAPPRLQEDRGDPCAVPPARVLVQKQPVLASSPRFPLDVTSRPSALTLVPRLDE